MEIENSKKNFNQKSTFKKNSDHLDILLKKSINKHLISERKIGLFLSGGTDSNALLNLISENFSEKNLDTFTYGFENDPNFDEAKKVKKLILNSKNIQNFFIIFITQ